MTRREAAIFTAFADIVVAPEPLLPPVADTDAADFFEEWIATAPRLNAAGVRGGLFAIDAAPVAMGFRRPLRRLGRDDRVRFLQRVEKHRAPPVRQAVKAMKGIAFLCYYGDDGVLKTLGYDADANLQRARDLRSAEGRP